MHNIRTLAGSEHTILYGLLSNDVNFVPLVFDDVSHNLEVITHQHHEIHEGAVFRYSDSITLGSGASQDYLITTPNTAQWAHLTYRIDGTAITSISFYEASNKDGTALQTVFNANRNSAAANTTLVHKGLTGGTTDGTLIEKYSSGDSVGGAAKTPAGLSHEEEWILKQNTKYIFRITSGTAGNLCNILLSWYEHTSKN